MIKNIGKITGSNFVYFGTMWLMFAFTSHYYGLTIMGIMALSASFCAPLLVLIGLSPRQSIVSGVIDDYLQYNFLRLSFLVIVGVLFGCCSFFFINDKYNFRVFLLFSIFKFIESYYEFEYAEKTLNKNFTYISKNQIVRSLQLLIFVVVSYITKSIIFSISSIIIYNILIIIKTTNYPIRLRFDFSYLRNIGNSIFMMSLSSFFVLFFLNTPRYFLASVGIKDVAIYSGLVNIVTIIRMLMQSYLNTMIPFLLDYIKEKDIYKFNSFIIKTIMFLIVVSFVFSAIYIMCGSDILKLIYGKEFYVTNFTALFSIGYAFFLCTSMVMNSALISFREIKAQFSIAIFLTILSIILSYILVSKLKINGAFLALNIICSVQAFISYIVVKKRVKYDR